MPIKSADGRVLRTYFLDSREPMHDEMTAIGALATSAACVLQQ